MFIVCKGDLAKVPYVIPVSEVPVYSLEELCYYIYNNIYNVTEQFFDERLTVWLSEQVHCESLAEKMKGLIQRHHDVKDLVVTLLCSCDYYREEEVRALVEVMGKISHLPPHQKGKIQADAYLDAGKYGKSLQEYKKIFCGKLAGQFTAEEYGNLLHNQAIAQFYVSSFQEAARGFQEAYARNHREESLDQYLYMLLIDEKEDLFEKECEAFGKSLEQKEKLRQDYINAKEMCRLVEEDFSFINTCKKELRASDLETDESARLEEK